MYNDRPITSTSQLIKASNQLSLLTKFDSLEKRDQLLIDELKAHIANIKYLRINSRYAESGKEKDLEETFNQILYWAAFLTWKKSRYIQKGLMLDPFLALTKDRSDVNVTEHIEFDTLKGYYLNTHRRFKTTCMVYKDILQEERSIVKRILDNFDTLHTISHAI